MVDRVVREWYDDWHREHEESSWRATRHYHPFVKGLSTPVLDVGCGTGTAANLAAYDYGHVVIALDASRVGLKIAARNIGGRRVRLVQGDGSRLPIKNESVQTVMCLGALEHFDHPLDGLREFWRVTRPGGYLRLLVPNAWFPGFWLKGGTAQQDIQENLYNIHRWRAFLEAANFTEISVQPDPYLWERRPAGLGRLTEILPLWFQYQLNFLARRD